MTYIIIFKTTQNQWQISISSLSECNKLLDELYDSIFCFYINECIQDIKIYAPFSYFYYTFMINEYDESDDNFTDYSLIKPTCYKINIDLLKINKFILL